MSVLTFPYDAHYQPPMPVVDLEVSVPGRASLQRLVSALVDSGSDGTLIPVDLLEEVGARCVGEARLRGMTGSSQLVNVYLVSLRVGTSLVHGLRVVAAPEQAELILGRNALNHLVVTLNGPASVTEISA
jgi:predicted aspartyl protease